jgi:hypothetical protein
MDSDQNVLKDPELLKVMPPANVSPGLEITGRQNLIPQVTGWRDPFISPWKAFDEVTGCTDRTYVLIAGGIQNCGPTVFMYRLPSAASIRESLTCVWEYLGPLIPPAKRVVPPRSPWVGDLGDNWECPSFITLGSLQIVIIGSEGKWADHTYPNDKIPSWQIWFAGHLSADANGHIRFNKYSEGIVDWGDFYAAQVFQANDGRTLSIG